MDKQDYNNEENKDEDFIDKSENYPSENEIISSQNDNNNLTQEKYSPPRTSLETVEKNQANNDPQNPQPQAPYLKYGAIINPDYLNNIIPPPVPDEIEQVNNNQNEVVIPIKQTIDYQQKENQPLPEPIKEANGKKNNQQQQEDGASRCARCCNSFCECFFQVLGEILCIALIGICEGLLQG